MEFSAFCKLRSGLAATRSRLDKRKLAAEFLRRLAPGEIPWAVAFLTGRAFPTSDARALKVRKI